MIYTPRTVLRPLRPADGHTVHALWTAPGLRACLWEDIQIPLADTMAMIELSVSLYHECGLGLCGVWSRDDGRLLGFVGYWFFREPPVLELVYGIAEEQWGRGLATEVVAAMVDYGFDRLGLTEIRASLNSANLAASHVLANVGFVLEQRAAIDGEERSFYRRFRAAPIS